MLLGSSFGFATTPITNCTSIEVAQDKLTLTIDLGDLTQMDTQKMKYKINEFIQEKLEKVDNETPCELGIKGFVISDGNTYEINLTIDGTCGEIKESAEEIINQLIADIKDAFEKSKEKNNTK